MSSPILPAEGLPGLPSTTPPTSVAVDAADVFIAGLDDGEGAPSLEAARGTPPPEVIDQIVAAHELSSELRENGYQLRFLDPPEGGRTRVELHDTDGNLVCALTTAQALEIAAVTPAG